MSKTILFVDDESDWRYMVYTYLTEAGYKVMTGKNGSEALLLSHGVELDAIIVDVNLGGENGVVLMEFLKRNHPGVPIILYTGFHHEAEVIQDMLKRGGHQYLRKGTLEELHKSVQNAIAHSGKA